MRSKKHSNRRISSPHMRGGTSQQRGVGWERDEYTPSPAAAGTPPHTKGRKSLIIIAAVAKNNVIGKNGNTPWNIPEEMALFTKATLGHVVIVGRKTYEAIGRPLPNRTTIVISRTIPRYLSPQVAVCSSVQEALELSAAAKTVFVIGGASIYDQMMPFASKMCISHLHEAFEGDSHFPPIDPNSWHLSESKEFPRFTHSRYVRI